MEYTESILNSIKKLLGPSADYTQFDPDIIIHINSAFMVLRQLGVGPKEGFSINNSDAVWTDFMSDIDKLGLVKSYIYLKVRLIFDPPTNSTVIKANEDLLKEYEWRLNVEVDPSEQQEVKSK